MTTTNDEDYTYAMKPLKILSWIMGVWPLEIYNVFTFIRSIFVIGILLLMILILSIEVYLDGSDAEANLDILLLTSCGFLAISKIACFRIYSAELFFNFSSAQKDYDELDDEEKRMILRRHAYLGRVALASLILSSNFGATFITILPIILKTKEEKNVTTEETVKYPIPSAHVTELVKFPENLQMIIFITEYMMMVMTSVGNLGSDGFFFGIVFHLCGQAEVLKMEFSRAVDENGKIVENFHLLLKRHIYLLKLGEMLSDTISVVLAIQLSTSCILICTCGFQFLLAVQDENIILSAKTLFVLNALMIQLFAFSYVGDYLKCQMDSIGYALYKCDWYMLPSNVAKNITFVILKAQKPVHLKAGKFFIVNLEGFMSILKTSMSYLSVLRVMINT
nr:odorant receptor 9a-like [Osmia lignaria]